MFALVRVLAVSVAVLALAGCAPAAQGPRTTPATSSTPVASATPTATKPALSDLVVTPDGLGYLVPGQPVPDVVPATAILTFDPNKCVDPDGGVTAGSPDAGAWIAAYPDVDTSLGHGAPFDVGPVETRSGPLHQIEVWSPQLLTAKRIGVGSTVGQLKAAYGSRLTLDSASNSDVYVLKGSKAKLLFEVAKDESGLEEQQLGTVVWMRIVPLADPYLHIANTDAAGPCSV